MRKLDSPMKTCRLLRVGATPAGPRVPDTRTSWLSRRTCIRSRTSSECSASIETRRRRAREAKSYVELSGFVPGIRVAQLIRNLRGTA